MFVAIEAGGDCCVLTWARTYSIGVFEDNGTVVSEKAPPNP